MELLIVGLNHKSAPLEVREKLALGSSQLSEALLSLLGYVEQGVILSTCNRTEVYFVANNPGDAETKRFLGDYFHLFSGDFASYLYSYQGRDVVRHLFNVASGVDSMIVGEFEILGQIGHALGEAEKAGAVRFPLINLFRQALRVGRRAREETAISRNAASVSSAGVELVCQFFNDLSRCKALIISAGDAAKLTAKTLVKMGVAEMIITSRTYDRALAMAGRLGGRAIPFHHLEEALAAADIVISCSGSPHIVLEPPAVTEAMRLRPQRPLLLIDIAVPRDIDPEVKKISNVFLYDIDDLKVISQANLQEREKEAEKVAAMVESEADKFMEWWDGLEVVPTIAALVKKYEALRQQELSKVLNRLSHLPEEDREKIDALTRSFVNKMIHHPIAFLKKHSGDDNCSRLIQEIFKLDGDKP